MAAIKTDTDLLIAYQAGDLAAFEQIYDRYAGALMAYLIGLLNCREDAEDALQDLFATFARIGRDLKDCENLRAYLFTSARNTAYNRL